MSYTTVECISCHKLCSIRCIISIEGPIFQELKSYKTLKRQYQHHHYYLSFFNTFANQFFYFDLVPYFFIPSHIFRVLTVLENQYAFKGFDKNIIFVCLLVSEVFPQSCVLMVVAPKWVIKKVVSFSLPGLIFQPWALHISKETITQFISN